MTSEVLVDYATEQVWNHFANSKPDYRCLQEKFCLNKRKNFFKKQTHGFLSGIFKCLWVTKICENSCSWLGPHFWQLNVYDFSSKRNPQGTKFLEKRKDVTANYQLLLKSFKLLSNLVEKIVESSLVHVILPALLIFSPKKRAMMAEMSKRAWFFLPK